MKACKECGTKQNETTHFFRQEELCGDCADVYFYEQDLEEMNERKKQPKR